MDYDLESKLSQEVKEGMDFTLKVIRYQMDELPNYIGKTVKCIYWELGQCKTVEGDLVFVNPYDRVIIGNSMIPFVGVNDAIEKISLGEEVIYTCSRAKGYEGCYAYDKFALIGAQQSLLGKSVSFESSFAPAISSSEIDEGQSRR